MTGHAGATDWPLTAVVSAATWRLVFATCRVFVGLVIRHAAAFEREKKQRVNTDSPSPRSRRCLRRNAQRRISPQMKCPSLCTLLIKLLIFVTFSWLYTVSCYQCLSIYWLWSVSWWLMCNCVVSFVRVFINSINQMKCSFINRHDITQATNNKRTYIKNRN